MKTLRLNLFLTTVLTALTLFLLLVPYSLLLGWNLFTGLIFWSILLPIAANLASYYFKSPDNLGAAILGALLFYAAMIFMIYKHYQSDLFTIMLYSILPTLFLLTVYNYRQIPFFRRKQ